MVGMYASLSWPAAVAAASRDLIFSPARFWEEVRDAGIPVPVYWGMFVLLTGLLEVTLWVTHLAFHAQFWGWSWPFWEQLVGYASLVLRDLPGDVWAYYQEYGVGILQWSGLSILVVFLALLICTRVFRLPVSRKQAFVIAVFYSFAFAFVDVVVRTVWTLLAEDWSHQPMVFGGYLGPDSAIHWLAFVGGLLRLVYFCGYWYFLALALAHVIERPVEKVLLMALIPIVVDSILSTLIEGMWVATGMSGV